MTRWKSGRDFGAVGDGVADDTAALQAGLEASSNRGSGGGTKILVVPNGLYRLTSNLVVRAAVGPWVYGESRDGVILRLDSGMPTNITALLRTHPSDTQASSADFFMRNFRNLTFDVGNNGIEDLVVANSPVALRNEYPNDWTWWGGVVALVGGRFTGGDPNQPAITNTSVLYARDVTAAGFQQVLHSTTPGGGVSGDALREYTSHPVKKLFADSPDASLQLPIRPEPRVPWETNLANWVCANDHGAAFGDNRDDTAALQAATRHRQGRPAFDVADAAFSATGVREISFGNTYPVKVREARDSDVRTEEGGGWIGWSLYSGRAPAAAAGLGSGLAVEETGRQASIIVPLAELPPGARPLEMVSIPAGSFQMGCPVDERGRVGREWPPHRVTITRVFQLGKYEVTQAQWRTVMGTSPAEGYGVGDDHPVYNVTWNDAQQFIARLNAMGKGTFRLPTEAEWEYACRAGTTTRFSFGDALESSDVREYDPLLDTYLWWGGNNGQHGYPEGAKRVGLKTPNPWGFHDIHGNVWEYCSDWWETAEDRGARTDPQGPASGTHKVMRGGAWERHALHLRSADRSLAPPDGTEYGRLIGLRLVREHP